MTETPTVRIPRDRKLIVLIHGILTSQTSPAWVDRLGHWLWTFTPRTEIIKRRYTAGPFPVWNVFVKNGILARALAEELRPYCEDGAELHFVTHSNGADIAVKTIRRLAKLGHKTKSAVFIGAAISAHLEKNGIGDLVKAGDLKTAFAYSSRNDLALKFRFIWPYGFLGRVGFYHNGSAGNLVVSEDGYALTRSFSYGHGGYFHPENEPQVFKQIRQDLFLS